MHFRHLTLAEQVVSAWTSRSSSMQLPTAGREETVLLQLQMTTPTAMQPDNQFLECMCGSLCVCDMLASIVQRQALALTLDSHIGFESTGAVMDIVMLQFI